MMENTQNVGDKFKATANDMIIFPSGKGVIPMCRLQAFPIFCNCQILSHQAIGLRT